MADRITADELNHITALSHAGDQSVTAHYLGSLQDKYAPVHTGNTQLPDTALRNTGGHQPLAAQTPGHTGNNQIPVPGTMHTGNTAGVTDPGIKTTITPIPQGPNLDDLAYLANGKDNRLPIPEPTVASNGLKVESNTKHTPGAWGFRPNAGIEPRNSLDLFGNSISIENNKARYSMGSDGVIHRYFPDNTGIYHWFGSTGDSKNSMQLDNKTKAQLRKQEG